MTSRSRMRARHLQFLQKLRDFMIVKCDRLRTLNVLFFPLKYFGNNDCLKISDIFTNTYHIWRREIVLTLSKHLMLTYSKLAFARDNSSDQPHRCNLGLGSGHSKAHFLLVNTCFGWFGSTQNINILSIFYLLNRSDNQLGYNRYLVWVEQSITYF